MTAVVPGDGLSVTPPDTVLELAPGIRTRRPASGHIVVDSPVGALRLPNGTTTRWYPRTSSSPPARLPILDSAGPRSYRIHWEHERNPR